MLLCSCWFACFAVFCWFVCLLVVVLLCLCVVGLFGGLWVVVLLCCWFLVFVVARLPCWCVVVLYVLLFCCFTGVLF